MIKEKIFLIVVFGFIASFQSIYGGSDDFNITGLPLASYSTDEDLRYGGRVYLYTGNSGSRSSQYAYPYDSRTYLQATASTKGRLDAELDYDSCGFLHERLRLQCKLFYERILNENYFGTDAGSTDSLRAPDGTSYSTYSGYEDLFLNADSGTFANYNLYEHNTAEGSARITAMLPFDLRVMTGIRAGSIDIDTKDNGVPDSTLMSREQPAGIQGGLITSLLFSVSHDTRDYEPDPKNGSALDISALISPDGTLSDYGYSAFSASYRKYVSFKSRFTLAMRAAWTYSTDGAPFFRKGEFLTMSDVIPGLGGYKTLRGYRKNRFVDDCMTLANAELRVRLDSFTIAGSTFQPVYLAFVDAGRAYGGPADPITDPDLNGCHTSWGMGGAVAWNRSTVIHGWVAMSKEDLGISINFNYIF